MAALSLTAPACQQGRAILAGLLDPVDRTEAYLDAARRHPHADRIFVRMTEDRARAEAIAAHDRQKAGLRRGLLDGVALAWKDNIDSAAVATEAGSRLLEGRTPDTDAAALSNATAAGAVCLGKTHMTELAFSGIGINPSTATPPNALDADRVPGGSSSGTAVAVALGLAAAGIGSDTGGSIRLPAAWNGLVGFKPSHGGVPAAGVVPLCRTLDVVGPLARSVEDCAALVALLRGEARMPDLEGASLSGLRLLVLTPPAGTEPDPEIAAAIEAATDRLGAAGARIARAALAPAAEALALAGLIYLPEAYGLWRAQIEAAPELMHPPTLARFRAGAGIPGWELVDARERLRRQKAAWAAATAGVDAVLLPTAPMLPPLAAPLIADEDAFSAQNLRALSLTRIANLLDLPAITLPTAQPGCGLMLMGRTGDDRALLRVAAAAEAALAAG